MARTKDTEAGGASSRPSRVRSASAVLVWTVCAGAALVMALATLLVALRVDEASRGFGDLVRLADVLDLGLLERGRGLVGDPSLDVVLPWGLTAATWLLVGRLLVALLVRRRSRGTGSPRTRDGGGAGTRAQV